MYGRPKLIDRRREIDQQLFSGLQADAGIGDALAVGELREISRQLLIACHQVAFNHHTHHVIGSAAELICHGTQHLGLTAVILVGIGMAAIHHEAVLQTGLAELHRRRLHSLPVIVATAVAAFQLVIFSALNLAIPSLTPVLFQVGLTMILFPIGYVILSTMSNAVQKLRTL